MRPISGPVWADPGSGLESGSDPGSDPGSDLGASPSDPSISDLNNILLYTVKRPYEPINLHNSSNKRQTGGRVGGWAVPGIPPSHHPPWPHHPGYTSSPAPALAVADPVLRRGAYGRGALIRRSTHFEGPLVGH